MATNEAVLLVGHGGLPKDVPSEIVSELKALEGRRRAQRLPAMTPREAELDRRVRTWPRTKETDPYKWGLEELAEKLRPKLGGKPLIIAYNEFCAPSMEDAIADAAARGVKKIAVVSTMFTRGGVHSELEIPEVLGQSRKLYPHIEFDYAWPFDADALADFLAAHVERRPVQKLI